MILISGVLLHRLGLTSDPHTIALTMLTARPLGLAVLLCAGVLLSGCTQRGLFENSFEYASRMATQKGWSAKRYKGSEFRILTYSSPAVQNEETLNVYIEGDGYAWVNRYTPSKDPSPRNPVGLSLALKDQGNDTYMARPCQFLPPDELAYCSPVFWTSARYAPEVITAMGEVLDQIKSDRKSVRIRLYGYSGGGVIAALLTARRADVVELITYAAPLDTNAWTTLHGLSPLRYSLNPADDMDSLSEIPQTHYVGGKDTDVPPSLLHDFVERLNAKDRAKVVVIEDANHSCCW
jgi:outer membrane lipoprotein-sorting protein